MSRAVMFGGECLYADVADPVRGEAPPFRAGKDSADGVAVLVFGFVEPSPSARFPCGVCCGSMYGRTMEIGAPPQLEAR